MSTADPVSTAQQAAIYRILDANLNRCLEGLRVIEEFLRFVLEDRHLAAACKQLRHDLVQATADLPNDRLHAARDAATDVGATIRTASEFHRPDARSVAIASWKRAAQALRSLEEYSKIIAPQTASQIEPIRFRLYTLEQATTMSQRGCRHLDSVYLYVLLDGGSRPEEFAHVAKQVLQHGADAVQLRDKQLADRDLLDRAKLLRQLTWEHGRSFIMNDRPDLAQLSQADAVHVGQQELTVSQVRSIVGPEMLVGVSTHSLEQAQRAVEEGANYLGCGPTFPSPTKSFPEFAGLDFLRQVSQQFHLPLFAIGGINLTNLPQVLATGMQRVALQDAVVNASNRPAVLQRLTHMLQQARNR